MSKFLLFLIFAFFLQLTLSAQSGWYSQVSGTTESLNAVKFFNKNLGIVVGNNGTILRTTNAGTTWEKQSSGTAKNLHNLTFIDANKIIVVGDTGTILRTSDGGASWVQLPVITSSNLSSVAFTNDKVGIAVGGTPLAGGDRRAELITTDGGFTWVSHYMGDNYFTPIYVDCPDSTHIIILGRLSETSVETLKSSDAGKTWLSDISGPIIGNYESIESASSIDSLNWIYLALHGVTLQYYPYIIKTTDGGVSWNSYGLGIDGAGIVFVGCDLINPKYIVCVGLGGHIFQSIDGGENWVKQASGTTNDLYGVCFIDTLIGTIVGAKGTILHYKNAPPVDTTLETPKNFILKQNYPNPFNPNTTIEYSIPEQVHVTIKIYDLLGREVTTLVNEEKQAGSYKVNFSAEHLGSGVYFYRLEAGGFAASKKLLLLK
jgi:photosystem II stability/assembly factor-like uncharacterized protein